MTFKSGDGDIDTASPDIDTASPDIDTASPDICNGHLATTGPAGPLCMQERMGFTQELSRAVGWARGQHEKIR
jgi:hypothetical protein